MSFKPMLAVAAEFDKIKYPVYASPKLDGIRVCIVDGVPKTRTLKDIPNKHVAGLLTGAQFSGLDGELIVGPPTSKTVYRDTVSEVMAHDKLPDFTYYVFDMHNVIGGYGTRSEELAATVLSLAEYPYIKMLECVEIQTEEGLLVYETLCIQQGYEGVMVRANLDAHYKYGRSTVNEGSLLKVKRFEDSEAEIIGFEEEMFNGNEAQTNELGRTKRSTAMAGLIGKGTLGAFKVRDVASGVEFAVGTGLTTAERQRYWDGRDHLVGSLVKYKFFPVGVKVAPRHPVFLGFRDRSDL